VSIGNTFVVDVNPSQLTLARRLDQDELKWIVWIDLFFLFW
jgi:hypothetical protein